MNAGPQGAAGGSRQEWPTDDGFRQQGRRGGARGGGGGRGGAPQGKFKSKAKGANLVGHENWNRGSNPAPTSYHSLEYQREVDSTKPVTKLQYKDDGWNYPRSVMVSLSTVRLTQRARAPFENEVTDVMQQLTDRKAIGVIDYQAERQRVRIGFKLGHEEACEAFHNKMLVGTYWPGTSSYMSGYRLDKPVLHVKVNNVSDYTAKDVVEAQMGRYGEVVQIFQLGTDKRTVPGMESFIWDGKWQVHLRVGKGKVVPSLISTDTTTWSLNYRGAVRLCFECGLPGHQAWRCNAAPRERGTKLVWTPKMGQHVDIAVIPDELNDPTLTPEAREEIIQKSLEESKNWGKPEQLEEEVRGTESESSSVSEDQSQSSKGGKKMTSKAERDLKVLKRQNENLQEKLDKLQEAALLQGVQLPAVEQPGAALPEQAEEEARVAKESRLAQQVELEKQEAEAGKRAEEAAQAVRQLELQAEEARRLKLEADKANNIAQVTRNKFLKEQEELERKEAEEKEKEEQIAMEESVKDTVHLGKRPRSASTGVSRRKRKNANPALENGKAATETEETDDDDEELRGYKFAVNQQNLVVPDMEEETTGVHLIQTPGTFSARLTPEQEEAERVEKEKESRVQEDEQARLSRLAQSTGDDTPLVNGEILMRENQSLGLGSQDGPPPTFSGLPLHNTVEMSPVGPKEV